MNLLHFLLSAVTIFVGLWGLFHDGFKGVPHMANVGTFTTGESGDYTDRMTMLTDNGASGNYFDDERHPDLKDKQLNYNELERPHKIVTARRHVLLGHPPSRPPV